MSRGVKHFCTLQDDSGSIDRYFEPSKTFWGEFAAGLLPASPTPIPGVDETAFVLPFNLS